MALTADEERRSARRTTGLQVALFAIAPAVVAIMAYLRRWISDDGYIYLRVVQNVLAGNGAVYNAGERMETATDPVWVGLVSLSKLVLSPVPLQWVTVVLGIALMVGALVVAQLSGLFTWRRKESQTLMPFGILVVAAVPAYWDFTTGGLDTSLVLLWIATTFTLMAAVVSGASARITYAAAVAAGLGMIIRPDLAPYTAAFVLFGAFWVGRHGWAIALRWTVIAGLIPGAYLVFRMGYYGALIPAPAISKGASRSDWGRGLNFVLDYVGTYWLLIPIAVVAVTGWWWLTRTDRWLPDRGHRILVVAMYAAALVQVLFVMRLGGGFMHARLLLPATFAALLPLSTIPLERRRLVVVPVGMIIAWGLAAALFLRPVPMTNGIADERNFYVSFAGEDHPITLADPPRQEWVQDALGHAALPGTTESPELVLPSDQVPGRIVNFGGGFTVAANRITPDARIYSPQASIGMYAFAAPLDLHVIDRFGLADPIASRQELEVPGRPGHAKILPLEWVVARFATEPVQADYLDPSEVAAARVALQCDQIVDLLEAATAPLTLSRFMDNLLGAPARTLLRIPEAPSEAVTEFCLE